MATGFVLRPGDIGGAPDPVKQRIAQAMLAQGIDTSPVQSWTQGAARLANALVGGLMERKLRQDQLTGQQQAGDALSKIVGAMTGGDGLRIVNTVWTVSPANNAGLFLPARGKRDWRSARASQRLFLENRIG